MKTTTTIGHLRCAVWVSRTEVSAGWCSAPLHRGRRPVAPSVNVESLIRDRDWFAGFPVTPGAVAQGLITSRASAFGQLDMTWRVNY